MNKIIGSAAIGGLMLLSVSSAFAQSADTNVTTDNSTNTTTEVNQTVTDNSREINVRCKFDNDQNTTVEQGQIPVQVGENESDAVVNSTTNQTVTQEQTATQNASVNVSSNQEGCNVNVNHPADVTNVTNTTNNNSTTNATTEVRTVDRVVQGGTTRVVQVPSSTVNRNITVPSEVANTGR